jgi:hypothetical protein
VRQQLICIPPLLAAEEDRCRRGRGGLHLPAAKKGSSDMSLRQRVGEKLEGQIAKCGNCDQHFTRKKALTTRNVESIPHAVEVGIECQHCGHWIHVCFSCPDLVHLRRAGRAALQTYQNQPTAENKRRYEQAEAEYQEKFSEYNSNLRERLGVTSPRELQAEQRAAS